MWSPEPVVKGSAGNPYLELKGSGVFEILKSLRSLNGESSSRGKLSGSIDLTNSDDEPSPLTTFIMTSTSLWMTRDVLFSDYRAVAG
jgi:hypothetical protein